MIINRIYYNSYVINISPEINEINQRPHMTSKPLITKHEKNKAWKSKSNIFKQFQKLITERIKAQENGKSGYILEENTENY